MGQCIRFEKKSYKLIDENGIQQNYEDAAQRSLGGVFMGGGLFLI